MRPSVPLGSVCLVIAGQSPDGSFYNAHGQGLPFYQGKKEFGERYIGAPTTWTTEVTKEAQEGDILISVRAPVGPINFATQRMCIGRGLAAIRCDGSKLHRDFLFYQLLFKRPEISGKEGAVFASINKADIEAIQIWLPHADEQRRIVAILDEAFEGIATAKAHAEKNLGNAREVFTGQLERIFSDPTPGWTRVKLEEIGSTQTGSTPRTSEPENFGSHLPFIKPGDFRRDGTLDYSNEGLSEIGAGRARRIAEGSALMVCIGATIGKAGFTEREVATNQQVNSWTPTGSTFGKFIYYQMTSMDFQRRVRDGAGQATLPIINKSKWSALTVVVPAAVEEQRRIVDELDAIQAETIALEELYQRKLAALDELKQSLLHQAFSGAL